MYEVRSLVADILQIGFYPTIPIENPYVHIYTKVSSLIGMFTIISTYIRYIVYMYIEELGKGKIILNLACQVALPHFGPSVSLTNVSQMTAGGGYIKMPIRDGFITLLKGSLPPKKQPQPFRSRKVNINLTELTLFFGVTVSHSFI